MEQTYLKVGQLAHLLHAVKVGIHVLLDSLDAVLKLAAHCAHEFAEALNVFLPGSGDLHQAIYFGQPVLRYE